MTLEKLVFPDGFEWSTATAAHQIEGGNFNNDWWRFEHMPGSVCVESSGDACDSWNRWSEDVSVLADLSIPGFRFSLEWSRIEPSPGEWSQAALDHYVRVAESLREAGIAPIITLNHFTLPGWLADLGSWVATDAPQRFAEFTHRAANRLGDLPARYCTLNEPNMVATVGYLMGVFPPGNVHDHKAHHAAIANMVQAHRLGVEAVRASSNSPVGVTIALQDYQAGSGGERAVAESRAAENAFLDATAGDDFVGVQTYTRMIMGPDGWTGPEPGVPVVEMMGYEYWPQALATVVRRVWEYTGGGVPILVTENGIATADDSQRIRFLHEALTGLHGCIADGIDVRGYTVWSLLDNFEWMLGYAPRFGIVEVDRITFKRTPKPSALWYGKVIRNNAIPIALDIPT
jgi:beta-glucosidase